MPGICGFDYPRYHVPVLRHAHTDVGVDVRGIADHVAGPAVEECVPVDTIAELMGHSSGETMSFSRYGKKYQPKLMQKEVINKIDYQINIKRTTK